MSIVTLLLFVLVFLLIVQYMLNNTKVLTLIKRKKLNGDIHTIGNSRSYRSFDISFLQKKYNGKKVTNLSKDGNGEIKN